MPHFQHTYRKFPRCLRCSAAAAARGGQGWRAVGRCAGAAKRGEGVWDCGGFAPPVCGGKGRWHEVPDLPISGHIQTAIQTAV